MYSTLISHISTWTITYENMETAPQEPQSRVFISLSKNHMAGLSQYYDMDHGFCITELNSSISGEDLRAYFNKWGNITMCDMKACPSSLENKFAFVMFSTEEEADRADWAGPHRIKETECKVRRIVNLKMAKSQMMRPSQCKLKKLHISIQ